MSIPPDRMSNETTPRAWVFVDPDWLLVNVTDAKTLVAAGTAVLDGADRPEVPPVPGEMPFSEAAAERIVRENAPGTWLHDTAAACLRRARRHAGHVVPGRPTVSRTGTPAASVKATEDGSGVRHMTTLRLASFAVGTSGDDGNKAIGALLYTLPPGDIVIHRVTLDVGLTLADAVQTDTPELGVGTLEADDTEATLGAVDAATENLFEGTAVADCEGTKLRAAKDPTDGTGAFIRAADSHALYLNVADGWADLTAPAAVTAAGTIVVEWSHAD